MSVLRFTPVLTLGALVLINSGTGRAQGAGAVPDGQPANGSTVQQNQPESYAARTVSITGSIRVRFEAPQGSNFTSSPASDYALSRIRFGIAFRPVPWLRFFGEAQDSRAYFYRVSPPGAVSDPVDLRQAYVEVGALEGNGFSARVGQQEVELGSGRLVGVGEWSNVTKTYDVGRGVVKTDGFRLDLVAGSPVLVDPIRMDRHKPGEHFYAAYSKFSKLVPHASIEPYFMAKTQVGVKGKDNVLGNADTLYAGARMFGTLPLGFDYTAEGVRQAGSYGDDVIHAWGYVAGGGWTYPSPNWKPHFSSDYLYGSGDSGLKDGRHEAFDNLYGLNQPINSLTGQVSWKNAEQWRSGVDFYPMPKLRLKFDFRDYWLATTADGLYNLSGTRTVFDAKAKSNHVGYGPEVICTYNLTTKNQFIFGFGDLRPGAYLRQAGKTTGYLYPSLSYMRTL